MLSIAIIPFLIIQLLWARKGFEIILALCCYLAAYYLVNAALFLYNPASLGPVTSRFMLGISVGSFLIYGTLIAIAAIAVARNRSYFA
ncbi:MAG: hypothetical protein ACYC75_03795 [Minisyncoccota bacterium]